MKYKKVSYTKYKVDRRLQEAKKIRESCVKHGISINDAAAQGDFFPSCFYNTVRDWRDGTLSEGQKVKAKEVLEILFFLNKSFSKTAKITGWDYFEKAEVHEQRGLFSLQPEKKEDSASKSAIEAAMFLTGKTREELADEALDKYCKELIREYMANL